LADPVAPLVRRGIKSAVLSEKEASNGDRHADDAPGRHGGAVRAGERQDVREAPIRPEDAPEGLIVHSAGPSEGGWYAYDIWESKEAFQRFAEEKLMPATRELGLAQPAGGPQFFEVHTIVQAK
jgi:hypothetical protein